MICLIEDVWNRSQAVTIDVFSKHGRTLIRTMCVEITLKDLYASVWSVKEDQIMGHIGKEIKTIRIYDKVF